MRMDDGRMIAASKFIAYLGQGWSPSIPGKDTWQSVLERPRI